MMLVGRHICVVGTAFLLIILGLAFRGARRVAESEWEEISDDCVALKHGACVNNPKCSFCEHPTPKVDGGRCSHWCGVQMAGSVAYYMDGHSYHCSVSELQTNATRKEDLPLMLQCSSAEQAAFQFTSLGMMALSALILGCAGIQWLRSNYHFLLQADGGNGLMRIMFPDAFMLAQTRLPTGARIVLLLLGAVVAPPTCAVIVAATYMDYTLPRKDTLVSMYSNVRATSALLMGIAILEVTHLVHSRSKSSRAVYRWLLFLRVAIFTCTIMQWPDPALISEETEWAHSAEPMLANVAVTVAVFLEVSASGSGINKMLFIIYLTLTICSFGCVIAGTTDFIEADVQAQWLTWIHGVMVVAKGFTAGFETALHDHGSNEHGAHSDADRFTPLSDKAAGEHYDPPPISAHNSRIQ